MQLMSYHLNIINIFIKEIVQKQHGTLEKN